jgi:hypothetical protein
MRCFIIASYGSEGVEHLTRPLKVKGMSVAADNNTRRKGKVLNLFDHASIGSIVV